MYDREYYEKRLELEERKVKALESIAKDGIAIRNYEAAGENFPFWVVQFS